MFPLKNYYEACIKREIYGMRKEDAMKRLTNILACHVVTKDTAESVHVRYFSCKLDGVEMVPNMDRWIGTIALRIEGGFVRESAISVSDKQK
ncbi:hypothetical protein AB1282_25550 [Gottfriedia sp. S16(2024)]|uniref:hypothetical protein n=1 Tax=Gottfriedia sp. S16(2024) TaxID=3162883 RepID=UPI003D1F84FB